MCFIQNLRLKNGKECKIKGRILMGKNFLTLSTFTLRFSFQNILINYSKFLILFFFIMRKLTTRYHEKRSTLVKQPIRTYIRLFPSGGIDIAPSNEYQILDGKTFLDKRIHNKFVMHPFSYIFTNQFTSSQQIEHMNIVDDCFQGKDQVIIADIDKENIQNFIFGNAEDPGFIISIFQGVFNQTIYHNQSKKQNIDKGSQDKYSKKEQNISISIFASESNSNKFIDLILGQRFSFYSKKDMDQHKDFYDKEIESMREFLILLKIVQLHYKQCCSEADPIAFRIIIDSYDEIKNQNYRTILHFIICQNQSKFSHNIARKIEFSLKNSHLRGEDHGSLANYIERELKRSKLIYIYGAPYRKSVMQNSVPMFQFLKEIRNHSLQFECSIVSMGNAELIDSLNKCQMPKPKITTHNFTHKQIHIATKLIQKFYDFLGQTESKWRNYCQIFQQILKTQKDFYQRQRFPISLQIQQFNVKSFLISKVYKLSETYQMDDLTIPMEKLRTIKNQIYISLKALTNCKEYMNLTANTHAQEFIQYFWKCIQWINERIRQLFEFRYREVQIYKIKMREQIKTQAIFDGKTLRELVSRLKAEAKKIKEKEQIYLRKIDTQNISPAHQSKQLYTKRSQASSKLNQNINIQKSFEMFKKLRTKRHHNFSQLSFNHSIDSQKVLNNSELFKSPNHNDENKLQNSPVIITKQTQEAKYNFYLPKIAIIRRKKGNTKS